MGALDTTAIASVLQSASAQMAAKFGKIGDAPVAVAGALEDDEAQKLRDEKVDILEKEVVGVKGSVDWVKGTLGSVL